MLTDKAFVLKKYTLTLEPGRFITANQAILPATCLHICYRSNGKPEQGWRQMPCDFGSGRNSTAVSFSAGWGGSK